MTKRILKGEVVSDKMDKTVIVQVKKFKKHPLYEKRTVSLKKYSAHDSENTFSSGDKVIIQETRPISKHKKWLVLGYINSGESK